MFTRPVSMLSTTSRIISKRVNVKAVSKSLPSVASTRPKWIIFCQVSKQTLLKHSIAQSKQFPSHWFVNSKVPRTLLGPRPRMATLNLESYLESMPWCTVDTVIAGFSYSNIATEAEIFFFG